MQRVLLTIPVGDKIAGDTYRVLGNVDACGRATASIDADRPITGDAAQQFWSSLSSSGTTPANRIVRTPRLYHGAYRFAVIAADMAGNESAGTPSEFVVVVNSGPMPPTRFRQTDVVDGRPVFAVSPPPQFVEE